MVLLLPLGSPFSLRDPGLQSLWVALGRGRRGGGSDFPVGRGRPGPLRVSLAGKGPECGRAGVFASRKGPVSFLLIVLPEP